MRCLRCALEYGPDEQYCQRCGRGLSRPLGSKDLRGEVATFTSAQAQSLYSTSAPPKVPEVTSTPATMTTAEHQTAGSSFARSPLLKVIGQLPPSHAAPPAAPPSQDKTATRSSLLKTIGNLPPTVPQEASNTTHAKPLPASQPRNPPHTALPPSIALARPTGTNRDLPVAFPLANPQQDAGGSLPSRIRPDVQRRAALPGGILITPPPNPLADTYEQRASADPYLDAARPDDEPVPRVKPAVIGIDADGWRKTPTRKGTNNQSHLTRGLTGAVAAATILLLGGFGFARHNAYNTDLHAGQDLTATGHYREAIARYRAAIADWPLNGSAATGLHIATAAATASALPLPATNGSKQAAGQNPGSASVPAATP